MSGTLFLHSNALRVHREALHRVGFWLEKVHKIPSPEIKPGSELDKNGRRRAPYHSAGVALAEYQEQYFAWHVADHTLPV